MSINPADAPTLQPPVADEGKHFLVPRDCRTRQSFIPVEEPTPSAPVADQDFTENQVVPNPAHWLQNFCYLFHKGRPPG